ncbi:MAG: LTA synthase family protein, partial [Bacteroidia bacterium]
IMTASDHGPYYVPPYFHPKQSEIKKQIVEYADWSIRQFFKKASQQPWYDSTLFVLVADHGAAMDARYDMPLSYNHTPLLFYSPSGFIPASEQREMAGQIDIFPTVMDYLNLPYQNNTLGINLNDSIDRPYIYFNGDDKYGVIDDNYFLIQKQSGESGLYLYKDGNLRNIALEHTGKVDSMRRYAESQLQTYQYIMSQE